MAAFDATALLHFTRAQCTDAKARLDHLIHSLEQQRETIIIPTPALSEALVYADAAGPS